jgi:hypothetical protein
MERTSQYNGSLTRSRGICPPETRGMDGPMPAFALQSHPVRGLEATDAGKVV